MAAVEGVLYGRSCGGVDGEVGFWGDPVAWAGGGGGGVFVGAPGGSVAHFVRLVWFGYGGREVDLGGLIVGVMAVNEVVVL